MAFNFNGSSYGKPLELIDPDLSVSHGRLYLDVLRMSPNYQVKIFIYNKDDRGDGGNKIVIGYLSAPFTLNFTSTYTTPLSNLMNNNITNAAELLSAMAGDNMHFRNKWANSLMYKTTSFGDLSFSFDVLATKSSSKIVNESVRALLATVLPSDSGKAGDFVVDAPLGHRLFNKKTENGNTSGGVGLKIGNYLEIPHLVVTSFSVTYDKEVTKDGNPLKATISLGFKYDRLPMLTDVDEWFKG